MKNTIALWCGIALIVMAILAGFSYGYAIPEVITQNNLALTMENIQAHSSLLTVAIICFWGVFLLDIGVAVGIYFLYKDKNKSSSIAVGGLRLLYTGFLGYALLKLSLLFSPSPSNNILDLWSQFQHIWNLGLIVFGLHLIGLGILHGKYYGKITGILLILGGVSYVLNSFGISFVENYSLYQKTLEVFLTPLMATGELVFAFSLIYVGIKKKM